MKLAVFATILIGAFQGATTTDVSGSWHVVGSVSDNPIDITCTLVQKDTALTGSCTRKDGKNSDVTGSAKDGVVSWSYKAQYNGDPIVANYNAKIGQDGTMAGKVSIDPYAVEGNFIATKSASESH